MWRRDPARFAHFQRWQNKRRKIDEGLWLASFVKDDTASSIFVGIWLSRGWRDTDVDEDGNSLPEGLQVVHHDFGFTAHLDNLIGRLVVDWGAGKRAVLQHADRNEKPIVELRKSISEPPFPGFAKFVATIDELCSTPPSWVSSLSSVRGVYLLTSTNGQQYIGAAYGDQGIWGRISGYVLGDQGNAGLAGKKLGDFTVTILDTAPMSASTHDVLALEEIWKRKLGSRVHGLNHN